MQNECGRSAGALQNECRQPDEDRTPTRAENTEKQKKKKKKKERKENEEKKEKKERKEKKGKKEEKDEDLIKGEMMVEE